MAVLMPEGRQSFEDSAGQPLVGGKLFTYAAGTSTPQATYKDAAGVTPNTNPIILDARGEAQIFWSGSYKVTLCDASDVVIWTQDNIISTSDAAALRTELAAPMGSSLIGHTTLDSNITTVRNELLRMNATLRENGTIRVFSLTPSVGGVNDAVLVARDIQGATDRHAYRDESVMSNITDYGGYASFDAAPRLNGANAQDHIYAFQARQQYYGTNLISHMGGFYSHIEANGPGIAQEVTGLYARNPLGTGPITTNIGVFIEELTRGTTNYAIVTGGNTPSVHGGRILFGANAVPLASQGVAHKGTRLTGAGQESFYASGVGLTATNYWAGFAAAASFDATAPNIGTVYGFLAINPTKPGANTIANLYGVQVNDLSGATNCYGLSSEVTSGAQKWNIFAIGSAQNYIVGKTGFGLGRFAPTAQLHINGGTTAAGTAPIKIVTAGAALMTTPEAGAFETDGTDLYWTNNAGVRKKVTIV